MEAWEIADKNGNPCDVCGHPWRRHLDSYDYDHLGCKYCECTIAPPGLMSRQDKINQYSNIIFVAKMIADKVLESHNVRTGYDMALHLKALAEKFTEAITVLESESNVFSATD